MRRILTTTFLGLLMTATSALAADDVATTTIAPLAGTVAAATLAQRTELAAGLTPGLTANLSAAPRTPNVRSGRPMSLPALYAGSAFLQGYDAYSTLSVLKRGGVEANPVMKGITKSPAAFIGLKAGVAAMSIMSAERMWKNNNRVGAVVTMVASNAMMAYVAAHNAQVLSRVQ